MTHCEELMANPKSTTPMIIVKQLKISSTGVLGTISPLPTVVTCTLSTALSHKLALIVQRLAAFQASLASPGRETLPMSGLYFTGQTLQSRAVACLRLKVHWE